MKAYLARLFTKWANRFSTDAVRIELLDKRLRDTAAIVIKDVEHDIPNASSENKHARAFARLRRLNPMSTKKDVGLAIELALRRVP
jgi:hypothetical protein